MAHRTPAVARARALERRNTYLECRDLLQALTTAVGQRRPLDELDRLRVQATEWLRDHPRNR